MEKGFIRMLTSEGFSEDNKRSSSYNQRSISRPNVNMLNTYKCKYTAPSMYLQVNGWYFQNNNIG